MNEFTGFRAETFQFFQDLSRNNTVEWFEENQQVYDEFVLEPMRGLVEALRPGLDELRPGLVAADPDAHFSEMRRGPRTPPNTPPIKPSMYAFFWDQDVRRLVDGNFFVGVSAQGVTIGFSIYDFGDPESRMRRVFKPRLARHLNSLDEMIKSGYLRRGFDFHRYVRAASRLGMREVEPFPTAATQWENTLGWVARRHIHTESSRLTPGSFVSEVHDSFSRLYPLYLFTSDASGEFQRFLRARSQTKRRAGTKSASARKTPAKPGDAVARTARAR